MIVFCVSGLWHGAEWSFLLWGALNGAYQVVGAVTKKIRNRFASMTGINKQCFSHRLLQMVITFVLVDFTWIFFRAENIQDAWAIIKSMIEVRNPWILVDGSLYTAGLDARNFGIMILSIILLMAADWFKYKGIELRKVLQRQETWFSGAVCILGIVVILVFGIWGSAYSAGSFIYFQF